MSLLASVYGICNPTVKNVWNHWVDHIMKQHSRLVLNGAALIRHNGVIAASSKGFIVSAEDLNNIKRCFDDDATETVRFSGVTYCIKSRDSEQIVSFNGQTYIIVCKTNCMYIIAKCSSRQTSGKAAELIKRTAQMLKAKKC